MNDQPEAGTGRTDDLWQQFEMAVNMFVKTTPDAHLEGILATMASYRDFLQKNVQRSRPVQPGEFVAWMNSAERDPDQFPEPWGASLVELFDGLIVSGVEEQNLQPAEVVDVLDDWVEYSHEEVKETHDLPDGFFDGGRPPTGSEQPEHGDRVELSDGCDDMSESVAEHVGLEGLVVAGHDHPMSVTDDRTLVHFDENPTDRAGGPRYWVQTDHLTIVNPGEGFGQ